MQTLRIGIVGLGKNTRLRHVPGFRECANVEIHGVCNRSAESTSQAAAEFGIPKTYTNWQELTQDSEIDAVMIGTWPYLHCPITLAALENGKHVLTEARMACNYGEARQMIAAAEKRPDLITQIVPSPFGLQIDKKVKQMLADGYVGDVREIMVQGTTADFADPTSELHWRQSKELSGNNMLVLGIVHETLIRWFPDPTSVTAATQTFVSERHGKPVERPDTVHILSELPGGIRCLYHVSGVVHHGPGLRISIYGTQGTMHCQLGQNEQIYAATRDESQLSEIEIPAEDRGDWRVEADFIDGIRSQTLPQFTDFSTGLRYMRFTDAVDQSASTGQPVNLA